MTTTAAPATTPFRFFDVHVVRTRRLGPSMVRITFGGERLGELASGGRDQRFKLFLPQAHQSEPVFADQGENWYPAWRAQDPAERPLMRSYTIREQRHEPAEVDVDFALHGADAPGGAAGGPASRWAAAAVPGDRVSILGPAVEDNGGVDFRPPPGTDWILLTGDETALPAVAGILAWLSPGTQAKVFLSVAHAADRQDLPTFADADITWLVADERPADGTDALLEAVRAAELPEGTPYAWIAGEAGNVKLLRRHLVRERAFDRRAVKFTGYWRRGASEEDLLAEYVAGTAAATDED
ncbi:MULTISPECIES: siderophore-interacting protein [Streptomyces]|uniref:Siderophore-interacting protein n=2 Tax=Streptomyces rimosus subsp. rimosus TaxID=132474 RepID=L8EIW9_STRR1|nr:MULTISPECIES: siderophore-interacting protein [Streptomyces]KOG65380.1 sialic acid transporter [Streptomyces griseoflavus]KOG69110.1 sialic acid transporter [Kitasatospora aureofaciens]MYT43181.1 SIP domain-containing protein [Streptomyces sp. SID5471]KEF04140.1 sialic acid transporter [Streptomyces rimosus]KEF21780.1 sialic acid transporter [Streptomyces rimosus]